jgi:hypothetical protein
MAGRLWFEEETLLMGFQEVEVRKKLGKESEGEKR